LANYIYTNFTNDKNSFHSQLDESLKRVYAKHDIIMSCINDYCKTTGIDNTTVIKLLNKTYIDIAEDMLFAINQRVDYINSGENLLKLLNMPINWFSYQRQ
ncbi:MAG: hypothetical protein NTU43_09435, partial [Bacteroidetes bacterium]|nr:hypothetical protein [Bacteroidota bacterium]